MGAMHLIEREHSRRGFIRLGFAATLLLAGASEKAFAAKRWCRIDPVVLIEGQNAHIVVAANVPSLREARRLSEGMGPIAITITYPDTLEAPRSPSGKNGLTGSKGFGNKFKLTLDPSSSLVATADLIPIELAITVPMIPEGDGLDVRAWFVPKGRGPLRSGQGNGISNVEFLVRAPK